MDLEVTNGGSAPSSLKKFRDDLKKTLTGPLILELENVMESVPLQGPQEAQLRPGFKYCNRDQQILATQDSDIDNALVFWAKYNDRFPQLHKLALKML